MEKSRKEYQQQWRLKNPEKSKEYGRKWRENNPEYQIGRQRPYHLKSKYGITEEDYNNLLKQQEGKCAICSTNTPTGKWKVFAVDHCHQTGVIRGLLCNECNRGMGLLRDSPDLLRKAVDYLEKSVAYFENH